MDAKAEAERVRSAFSNSNDCTTATVTTLRRLLEVYDDNKENVRPGQKPSRKGAGDRSANVTTKGPKERQPEKSKSKPSSGCLTTKEQHNLATELVNKTLKILTEAARTPETKGSKPTEKTSKAQPKEPRKQAPSNSAHDKLASVATCSRIAFATLRRLRESASGKPGTQLEQGMIALVGKLLSLGLFAHAEKELVVLRRLLQSPNSPKRAMGSTILDAPASIITLYLLDSDLPRLKLAAQYQTLVLRFWNTSQCAFDEEMLVHSLDPDAKGGPFSTLTEMRSTGEDISDVVRSMETIAQLTRSLARPSAKRPQISAMSAFHLDMHALRIRKQWWDMAGHKVDLIREVIEPLRHSLKVLTSNSSLGSAEQYSGVQLTLTQTLSWHMFSNMNADDTHHYNKLLTLVSGLAASSGNISEARRWLPSSDIHDASSQILDSIRNVLLDTKTQPIPNQTALVELRGFLESCHNLTTLPPETEEVLSSTRRSLLAYLVKRPPLALEQSVLVCRCLMDCLNIWQKCPGRRIMALSFAESGILASSIWLKSLAPKAADVQLLLASQTCLRDITSGLQKDADKKLLLAMSDLQWHIFHYCKRENKLDGASHDLVELLTSAVNSLYGLSTKDSIIGNITGKLVELVGLQFESRLYRESCRSLSQLLDHFSEMGFLHSLTASLESIPIMQALEILEPGSVFLETIALTRRLGREWKKPCLQEMTKGLTKEHSVVFHYSWLMTSTESSTAFQQQDFDDCVSLLLAEYTHTAYPVRRLQICQRVLALSVIQPSTYSHPIPHGPSTSLDFGGDLGLDCRLAKYSEHVRNLWDFTQSLCKIDSVPETFSKPLDFWYNASVSSTVHNSVDDLNYLMQLLVDACPFLQMNGYLTLAEMALQICDRLCSMLKQVQTRTGVQVEITRCRIALQQGDGSKINQSLAKLPKADPSMQLDVRLDLADTRLRLSFVSFDMCQIREALSGLLNLTTTSGLHRHEKMQVYAFQANIGLVLASSLAQLGHYSQGGRIARASLLLFKSILASTSRSRCVRRADGPVASDHISTISDSLSRLDLSDGSKEYSSLDEVDATTDPQSVGRLFDCMLLLSRIASSQGNANEVRYYLDQAKQVIQNSKSEELKRRLAIEDLQLQVFSGLESGESLPTRPSEDNTHQANMTASAFSLAYGDWHAKFDDVAEALNHYALAEKLLAATDIRLSSKQPTKTRLPARSTVNRAGKPTAQPRRPLRSAQNPSTITTKALRASAPDNKRQGLACEDTCGEQVPGPLTDLAGSIARHKALALLKDSDLPGAMEILARLAPTGTNSSAQQLSIAQARLGLAQAAIQLMTDVNHSTLPESTLAVPSIHSTCPPSREMDQDTGAVSKAKATNGHHQRSETAKTESIQAILEAIKAHISSPSESASLQSLLQVYELSSVSISTDMLSSAVSNCNDKLHPCHIAHMLETPANEAFRRQILDAGLDKKKTPLPELLKSAVDQDYTTSPLSAVTFQDSFVNVLPGVWTVISLSMNEEGTELWAARYCKGALPFILRLPMTRSRDSDIDEETPLTYSTAKAELCDIIKRSDYSCHNPPDPDVKGGKSKWWEDREALDAQMHDLLTNIENIWFGGFKGFLSLHHTPPNMIARFQKSFEAILDRHLPSRRGNKAKREKVVLHSQILELFVRLPIEKDEDIDDHIMDLLFFIVDILRYNNEPNAYDEIDLDAMTVETFDAIRAYHHATGSPDTSNTHLILRLDKRLHCFPWESLPCLQGASISRVSSLLQLRERLLAMRQNRHTIPRTKGTFILNPSGDLGRTQTTLLPALSPLETANAWTPLVRTKPDEPAFLSALSTSASALLYFGHGSGAQYVRPRAIERLDACAPAVWLMGCSSGLPTEEGQFETTSVPLSYLVAGKTDAEESLRYWTEGREGLCMAVVATLWDVTDRDIDKFSLSVGEKWGLWREEEDVALAPKTPSRKKREGVPKTPGRNRKAKIVEEVEGGDDGGMSLTEAVARSRDVCYLRYLNGAASVVYGVPVYLEK